MKENDGHPELLQTGDENIFNFIYKNYLEIQSRFTQLNNTYNVGVTQFKMRLDTAELPIKIGAFKPGSEGYNIFLDNKLIPNELNEIFKIHKLI
jgi:hypothetical protein